MIYCQCTPSRHEGWSPRSKGRRLSQLLPEMFVPWSPPIRQWEIAPCKTGPRVSEISTLEVQGLRTRHWGLVYPDTRIEVRTRLPNRKLAPPPLKTTGKREEARVCRPSPDPQNPATKQRQRHVTAEIRAQGTGESGKKQGQSRPGIPRTCPAPETRLTTACLDPERVHPQGEGRGKAQ